MILTTAPPVKAAQGPDSKVAALCDQAAQRAARANDVPLDVMRAITRVETGRSRDGTLLPWPWTVNMEGAGHWFPNEYSARKYVFERFKSGARSFDVGCFQINYRWHSSAFKSIDDMFDPDKNADYAARFLKDLHQELGSWRAAAGAFHSRTETLAAKYERKFDTVFAALSDAHVTGSPGRVGDVLPLIATRQGPTERARLGSLVPTAQNAAAFISFN